MGLRGLTVLFYYDCLGHQELENIAHDGCRLFIEFVWWTTGGGWHGMEWDGTDPTP